MVLTTGLSRPFRQLERLAGAIQVPYLMYRIINLSGTLLPDPQSLKKPDLVPYPSDTV
jgi:hypothetical protein